MKFSIKYLIYKDMYLLNLGYKFYFKFCLVKVKK